MVRPVTLVLFLLFNALPVTFLSPVPVTSSNHPVVIEGDIVYTKNVQEIIATSNSSSHSQNRKRKVIRGLVHYWPGGLLPYVIDAKLPNSNRKAIRLALRDLQEWTCLKFVPRTKSQKDYVHFVNKEGCFSSVGRQGGEQKVSLGDGCDTKGKALHEILHTLGFFHEHSRNDRDKYIKVLWWNIIPGMEKNFATYSHDQLDDLGYPYDVNSIMQYGNDAFSLNGRDTLEKIGDKNLRFGDKEQLSAIDVKQLQALYKCKELHWGSGPHKCINKIKGCNKYSLDSDACESNFAFMKLFCKKSCAFCGI